MKSILTWLLIGTLTLGPAAAASPYAVSSEPRRPRTFLIPPVLSFILPGFDQWWEGQPGYGALYSGLYVGSLVGEVALKSRAGDISQFMPVAGGFSLYHSFRTAVQTREDFAFLKTVETPADLALAPFRVSYLGRVTTLIPLVVAFGIGFLEEPKDVALDHLTATEAYRATSRSYVAGTWEEAVFRGWMMPVLMHYTGSEWFSNVLTASVFALAHLPSNPRPYPQFAAGLYFGYVSQQNGWTIGESIFMHAWYDLFLFLGSYLRSPAHINVRFPTLSLAF